MKRKVGSRSLHFTLFHVKQETEKHIKGITVQDIAKYVRHAQKKKVVIEIFMP